MPETSADPLVGARRAAVALALLVPLVVSAVAYLQPWLEPAHLTRDPLALAAEFAAEGRPCCSRVLGAISTLGVCLWAAAGAAYVLAAVVLSARGERGLRVAVMVIGAALSVWLVLDDGYMLHERFGFKILGIGMFNAVPAGALALLAGTCVVAGFRASLPVLALTFAALAASVLVDAFAPQTADVIFWEDAFKLAGICLYAAFALLTCADALLRTAPSHSMRPASRGIVNDNAGK